MLAAKNAGMQAIVAQWGYLTANDNINDWPHDLSFQIPARFVSMDQSVIRSLAHEAHGAGAGIGSDEYYATRFFAPQIRYRTWCVLTLKKIIEDIPVQVSDMGVARLKLAWWQDAKSRVSHPVFKIGEQLEIPKHELHAATESLSTFLDEELIAAPISNNDALLQWFNAAYSPIYEIIGKDLRLAISLEQARSPITNT